MEKIKVLQVVGEMNRGGAETMLMNVYRSIDREKVQFDFLCLEDKEYDFNNDIKELGGKIYAINSKEKTSFFKYLKNLNNFFKYHAEQYNVIHIHTLLNAGIVAFFANKYKIKNIIIHSHNTKDVKQSAIIRKLYEYVCKMLIKHYATYKLACGIKAAHYLYGKNIDDVIIINNSIRLEDYNKKDKVQEYYKKFNIDKNTLVIGNVARFCYEKNHHFFIPLAKQLLSENIKFKIILVGDGEKKQGIEREIKENNLTEYFYLLGLRKDIPELMSIFNVFVLPSLFEGFPMVMIEAQASALPCVVSDTISKETEIVKGMVSFVNLTYPIKEWTKKIIEMSKLKFDSRNILNQMENLEFSSKKISEKFLNIYYSKERGKNEI